MTCPWHGWTYEIRTGTLAQDPRVGVSKHEVRLEGDSVSRAAYRMSRTVLLSGFLRRQ